MADRLRGKLSLLLTGLVLTIGALLSWGCESAEHPEATRCDDALDGRSFMSAMGECGWWCPCGLMAGCNWTVRFASGVMDWSYSDTGRRAEVVCLDGEIRDARTGEHYGTYDRARDDVSMVHSPGSSYAACDGSCDVRVEGCEVVCSFVCTEIAGLSFRSRLPRDCGRCPDGSPRWCHPTLGFSRDRYRWVLGAKVIDGEYDCRGGELTATGWAGWYSGRVHLEYSVDLQSSWLDWEGQEYDPCPGECEPEPDPCPPR